MIRVRARYRSGLLLIYRERACPFVGSHEERKEAHEGKRQLRIIVSFLHARAIVAMGIMGLLLARAWISPVSSSEQPPARDGGEGNRAAVRLHLLR
jgi:hypothetical protein